MKLYRVTWSDESYGAMQRWFPSKVSAQKGVKAIKAEYQDDKDWTYQLDIEVENVPTTKAGLLTWLNDRFNTDNG